MIPGIEGVGAGARPAAPSEGPRGSFEKILRQETLRFSKHAEQRLVRDGITLNEQEKEKLQDAMDRAAAKGAREALLLMDDKAFIANVREKVVITSMARGRLLDNVFVHIDSAVVV